jgi:hypothetical protein
VTAAGTLTAWGIVRASEVIELAAAANLPLAHACAMLENESAGGRNVWGGDNVPGRGVLYRPGTEVMQVDYLRYRAAVQRREAGRQGVGPTQLTYGPYQDEADAIGGCWDWRANVRVGFGVLSGLLRQHGPARGLAVYNGGPRAATPGVILAADSYSDKAMRRAQVWSDRLGSAAAAPSSTTPEACDVSWTKAEGAPSVPDLYGEGLPPLVDPLWALANATAHAAHARDEAGAARSEVRALRTDLASALARNEVRQAAPAPQIDYAQLAAALIAAVAGRDAR